MGLERPLIGIVQSQTPLLLPVVIDPSETVAVRLCERFVKFRRRDRSLQFGIVAGAISMVELVHQVEIGIARNRSGEKPHHVVRSRDPVGSTRCRGSRVANA